MQRCWQRLGRSLLSSAAVLRRPVASPVIKPISGSISVSPAHLGFRLPPLPLAVQARHFAAKDRSRAPATPVTSKVKKYKLKSYSSFKFRFRTMNDGQIRRWRAGKRHNAHLKVRRVDFDIFEHGYYQNLKSKKSKRRLRKPEIVHAAYAKVLKKLNFCG